jgi:hypothetical protein
VTVFKNASVVRAFTKAMNELSILRANGRLWTTLALAGLSGCAGDAVKLGTAPEQDAPPNYERFTLSEETTANLSESPQVEPHVVKPAGQVDFVYGSLLVLLPDARLATVQLRAIDPPRLVTPGVHVALLSRDGTELASGDYQVPGVMFGLQQGAKLFGGYDEGLWVALLGSSVGRFTRFDADLKVTRELTLPAAEVQDIYEPIDSFLQVGEVPLASIATLPATSDCRRLAEDSASRLRSRVWTADGLWMMGCSSPPKGLPNALAKPAVYQCSPDGELQRSVVLDVLAKSDACFSMATVREGFVIGVVDLDEPTIVRVDMARSVFAAQHLHKQAPPLTQASLDPGNGSVTLRPRFGFGRLTLGAHAEVLLSARDFSQGSDTDTLCLAPSNDRVRCVRVGSFDSVFSSIALSEDQRAYVFTRSGELWSVAFPEPAP